MKDIKSYARFLEIFCFVVVIPGAIFNYILKWLWGYFSCLGTYGSSEFWTSLGFYSTSGFGRLVGKPLYIRFLGMAVDSVSLILLGWGVFCFIKVLRCYRRGEIFTQVTLSLFRKISRIAFFWAVYQPVKGALLSLVFTLGNPPGQRLITLSINSNDIFNIFLVGFFLIITSLIYEGFSLKQEQDLTV